MNINKIPKEVLDAINLLKNEELDANTSSNIEEFDKVLDSIKFEAVQFRKGKTDEIFTHSTTDWDYKKGDVVLYFDTRLSYQHTGYKPINRFEGLNFNPEWFIQTRKVKLETGSYCEYSNKLKAYRDFWIEQIRRCIHGYKVNGYTITGDHYFFLNFYKLPIANENAELGSGRPDSYPAFYVGQYEYFHYIKLCRVIKKDALGVKARGVGFSEIGASIAINTYTSKQFTNTLIVAEKSDYVDKTFEKCKKGADILNTETEGGLRRARAVNQKLVLKSGQTDKKGEIVGGWRSSLSGIYADTPNKIRGDRTDLLIYEESGSWVSWLRAWLQGDALVFINGVRFGIKMAWGTGGDKGPALAGLKEAYENPKDYGIMPFRHNYTGNEQTVITGFFIPAYKQVTSNLEYREHTGRTDNVIDSRGWTDPEKGKLFYEKRDREPLMNKPEALIIKKAEYCFTAEEAFALEGQNNFNKVLLSEQLAQIKIHKKCPPIERGSFDYVFMNNDHSKPPVSSRWIPNNTGLVHILEHPEKNEMGSYKNLYIAGIDSIDMGAEETSSETRDPSDFCIVIKKRAFGMEPSKYVAYYKFRPNDIREAYKIALCMLMYYDCQAVLEYTRINIKEYFRSLNQLGRLMKRPAAVSKSSNSKKSNLIGVTATKEVIEHQLTLIASYIEDTSEYLWFDKQLEELLAYSYENKTKFDFVAAMGMCELGDEELRTVVPKQINQDPNQIVYNLGYFINSKGYKEYGPIPKRLGDEYGTKTQINYKYDGPKTSDTRLIEEYFRSM